MRPTAHTFDQVNWDNAEQETRIGALQEMVAILLNRLDEAEAASPAALDVERARRAFEIHDMEHHGIGGLHPESCDEWIAAEYARLSPSEGSAHPEEEQRP